VSDPYLRVGIIGCGDYGRRHIRRLSDLPEVRIAAISDPAPSALETAERLLHDLGARAVRVFADYRDLLSVPLDAVCIASPDLYHVPQVVDALQAGLHVLCEKPLTASVAELERVLLVRDQAKRVVCLTYQRRYDPRHRAMRREVLSGKWGCVQVVSVYNSEDWITPNVGTWRHDPDVCPGGFFYDASGHQLDFLFWTTGLRVHIVQAWKHHAGTAVPIRVWGNAVLDNGVPMTFCFVGDADAWREQINIHCERRDFFVESYRPGATPGKAYMPELGPSQRALPLEVAEEPLGADAEFVRVIRGELPNPAPPEDTRPVIRFTEAALKSAELGVPVNVEP